MKIKVAGRLRPILSKRFISKSLPELTEPIEATEQALRDFWNQCSHDYKLNSLCFLQPELTELVNKTNSRLLYADLLTKASESAQKKR